MRILIIGGTRFLGRHLVEAALRRGHQVTLFNRGQTNPGLFPQAETILGDRNGSLESLAGRRWEVAIDTCGYFPRAVRAAAQFLSAATRHYTFISSVSVYTDESTPNQDETAPVGTLEDETVEEITGETYGPLKVLCEQAVQAAFPQGALIIRPGLIVGPYDPSDRFTYWPVRLARGGQVLAPGDPLMPVQIIDARDLAAWNIRLVENRVTGVFNAAGPESPLVMQQVITTCREVAAKPVELTWVSEQFLLENRVAPFTELPLWLPKSSWGSSQVDISRALAAGLKLRPLAETAADTLVWAQARPSDYAWVNGLKLERETELLAAWHNQWRL